MIFLETVLAIVLHFQCKGKCHGKAVGIYLSFWRLPSSTELAAIKLHRFGGTYSAIICISAQNETPFSGFTLRQLSIGMHLYVPVAVYWVVVHVSKQEWFPVESRRVECSQPLVFATGSVYKLTHIYIRIGLI